MTIQQHANASFLGVIIVMASSFAWTAAAFADEREEYFEKNVRPLLAKRCFECHADKKQESDIRVDHKSTVFRGGGANALVIPSKPNESRLLQVMLYKDDDSQMPPDEKMPQEELDIIRYWIEQGAYWPEPKDGEAAHVGQPRHADGTYNFAEAVKLHWAYQPVKEVSVPEPKDNGSCQTSIDQFIQKKLETHGLSFSPRANRETLIRRIALDLVGMPPSFEEVQAFVNDERPDALERVIDRYLASPAYGERWGRFWLDIARYADTKGYVFTDNRYYPFSYTYRDYVVKSLNEDKPYDQFLREQIAADRLGYAEDDPRLAALGFLTVGNRFLNRNVDIIDDRIDLVTRGLMGMTVACARCHDHKYDPIPTADYYSLFGVFDSSTEPAMGPVVGKIDEQDPEYVKFKEELEKREGKLKDYCREQHDKLQADLTAQVADNLLAAGKLMTIITEADLPFSNPKPPRDKLRDQWRRFIDQQLKAKELNPVWIAWKSLTSIPDAEFAAKSPEVLTSIIGNEAIPQILRDELKAQPLTNRMGVVQAYGRAFTQVVEAWKKAKEENAETTALADAKLEQVRKVLFGEKSVSDVQLNGESSPLFERDQNDQIRRLRASVADWYAQSPGAPARAMVMLDKEKPVKPVIFLRGDPNRRGPAVDRHSPRILQPEKEIPYTNGSGRLELADEIVAPSNPLTARVIVNRIWGRHLGTGIVDTFSDFGTRGSEPTNQDLLDYLAWTFVHEDNWSLKSLHRRIMLSNVYLQESNDRPEMRDLDPINTFYWRQNRQRMEFEVMRDSMLAVAGQLKSEVGGRPIRLESPDFATRRTIYALIDRNNLPGLFRTFDYPSPDTSSPNRPITSVPQQTLFLLNSPFMLETSVKLAESIREKHSEPAAQAQRLIEQVFSRTAKPAEVQQLTEYLEKHPLEQLCQAMLITNEFLYVD